MADFDYSGYNWNDPNTTARATYDRLLSLGVQPQTAAGAIGSLMGESGARLNTRALNPGDGADGSDSVGMGQWNGPRAVALRQTAQRLNLPMDAPQAQIEHLAGELQGSHRHVLRDLIAAGDDLGAGQSIWTRRYEVAAPRTAHEDRRLRSGMDFYNRVSAQAPADPQTTGSVPDPWTSSGPNYTNLPAPALSPQFQATQLRPGTSASVGAGGVSLAPSVGPIGSIEMNTRGPSLANAIPGQPNVTDPTTYGSGMGGNAFDSAFPGGGVPASLARPPISTPTPQTGPYRQVQPPIGVPTSYTGLQGEGAPQSGGFLDPLGIRNMSDIGKRMEKMGAWFAPPGNAQAALGFRQAENTESNSAAKNAREDQELELKKQAQSLALMRARSAMTDVSTSANGKFRVIQKTNPITGEVSFDRAAIPEDEQDTTKRFPKAPAGTDKLLNDDEGAIAKNINLLRDGEELRDLFRAGQVDVSLIGKAESELKTLADSGDPRAANAMRVRAYLQGAINNTLRGEKGVQTDSDAKRVASEVLSGSANYNNSQMYSWLGRYMGTLNGDVRYRAGRSQNTVKRYGPDFDPDGYRAETFGSYGDMGRSFYDSDARKERENPYRGTSAPAGRVTSPILEDLRRRGVIR